MLGNELDFRLDDLSCAATRALVERHLGGMYETTPSESVHALGIAQLRASNVTFWSAWVADTIAGCGALQWLDRGRAEIKSMRVADAFLGRGFGRAILEHLIAEARRREVTSLWLETGSAEAFA